MAAQQPARTSPELRARLHSARANVGITPRPGALPGPVMPLALVLFSVLSMVAALHAYWALGGLWPGNDSRQLADTVIGDRNHRGMPPTALTLLGAALIFAAGALPVLHLTGLHFGLPGWLTRVGLWVLVPVFLGRGAVTYVLRAQAAAMAKPFATLNRRYYSPLCLVLGFGFFVVVVFS